MICLKLYILLNSDAFLISGGCSGVTVHTWRDRGFLAPAVAARGVRASSEGNLRK